MRRVVVVVVCALFAPFCAAQRAWLLLALHKYVYASMADPQPSASGHAPLLTVSLQAGALMLVSMGGLRSLLFLGGRLAVMISCFLDLRAALRGSVGAPPWCALRAVTTVLCMLCSIWLVGKA